MVKSFIIFFAFLLRMFYPYKLHEFLQLIVIRRVRSYWLYKNFAHCDSSVYFGKIGRIHGEKFITIAESTRFNDFFYLTTWPEFTQKKPVLKIGKNCTFGAYNHLSCTNEIIIGNNVLTGKWVTISDNNHGDTTSEESLELPPSKRPIVSKGPIIIEDNVWIGDKATILAGVRVGRGAVIAANAVVTKDVAAYCVVGGCPAKVIKNH